MFVGMVWYGMVWNVVHCNDNLLYHCERIILHASFTGSITAFIHFIIITNTHLIPYYNIT